MINFNILRFNHLNPLPKSGKLTLKCLTSLVPLPLEPETNILSVFKKICEAWPKKFGSPLSGLFPDFARFSIFNFLGGFIVG